jgi:glutaredoxin
VTESAAAVAPGAEADRCTASLGVMCHLAKPTLAPTSRTNCFYQRCYIPAMSKSTCPSCVHTTAAMTWRSGGNLTRKCCAVLCCAVQDINAAWEDYSRTFNKVNEAHALVRLHCPRSGFPYVFLHGKPLVMSVNCSLWPVSAIHARTASPARVESTTSPAVQ